VVVTGWHRARAGGLAVLLAPAVAIAVAGTVLVLVPFGRGTLLVNGRLDLVTFLLAAGTSLALVEPAGQVADATPTGRLLRRSTRLAVASAASVGALSLVRIAAPDTPGATSFAPALAELAAQITVVAAAGAVASRWRPEATAAAGASAVGVLVGAGPELARLDAWSTDARTIGADGVLALALAALVAFATASRDPAAR
jgi:hypothetical protein